MVKLIQENGVDMSTISQSTKKISELKLHYLWMSVEMELNLDSQLKGIINTNFNSH